ncbi:MAG TPA: mannonate dehydratase [Ignavibacteriaceae bacterium]|nr:mannonate dehydratase [Ignavibacteriaceae bacterium]
MSLEQTWRWFGPKDPISLNEIKQTGTAGIVTALHHIPIGEIWTIEEIMKRKDLIESAGLKWSVTESLPIHEDIKKTKGNYKKHIENYKISIKNLGKCRIDTICYNFMPVLDWSRTDLKVQLKDGSITSKFEIKVFAAFDLYILKRKDAEKDYSQEQIREAKKYFESLSNEQKDNLLRTVLLGFPGSGEAYTLDGLRSAINEYNSISPDDFREHLFYFLKEIIPAAEESHILMGIHPDDPPRALLGLPRVVSHKEDIQKILQAADSTANGLTLCTGSFGASIKNNLVDMAQTFAPRINFIHLRNVKNFGDDGFIEENHLEGDVDMYGVIKALLLEQNRRREKGRKDLRMPFRPDHGHLMTPDRNRTGIYPGYSLFGRMRGLAELRGLEMGIKFSLGL